MMCSCCCPSRSIKHKTGCNLLTTHEMFKGLSKHQQSKRSNFVHSIQMETEEQSTDEVFSLEMVPLQVLG